MFASARHQIGAFLHPYARPFEEFIMGNPNTPIHNSGAISGHSALPRSPHIHHSSLPPRTPYVYTIPATIRPHFRTHR